MSKASLPLTYAPEFEDAWKQYPERIGSNPKRDAWHAWSARKLEGVAPEEMLAGTVRYARFCEVMGKTRTEFVMQARRFYGPSQPFAEQWVAAKPSVSDKFPWPDGDARWTDPQYTDEAIQHFSKGRA